VERNLHLGVVRENTMQGHIRKARTSGRGLFVIKTRPENLKHLTLHETISRDVFGRKRERARDGFGRKEQRC
jgi:hypothetical protein